MARYIELDQDKIKRLKREAQFFQDDIVCAIGTDFMQKIAEAENKMIFDILNGLEVEATADVAPKSEVAREIFEEMQSCLMIRHWCGNDILTFEFDAVKYAELKKKYTEGKQ